MPMSIRTNVSSLDAQKNLMLSETDLGKSLARLSSGYRITKAQDDAAGLAISVNLVAQIRSYEQVVRNANDALNVVQTAEASQNEIQNILTRLRELASQSASSGVSDTERGYIQTETAGLISEIDRIANATEFNGIAILNGINTLTFQVGIRNVANNDQLIVTTANVTSAVLGMSNVSLASLSGASAALAFIDSAMQTVSSNRAQMGAQANRMEKVISTATQAAVSLSAANSRIRDVNVAEETANLTRNQIILQAGVSVLAQANQLPQTALKLLGG